MNGRVKEWVNVRKLLSSIKTPLEDSGHEIKVRPIGISSVSSDMFSCPDAYSKEAENLIEIEWRLCQMDIIKQDKDKGVMGMYTREVIMIAHGL